MPELEVSMNSIEIATSKKTKNKQPNKKPKKIFIDEVTCVEVLHAQCEHMQPDKVRAVSFILCNHIL